MYCMAPIEHKVIKAHRETRGRGKGREPCFYSHLLVDTMEISGETGIDKLWVLFGFLFACLLLFVMN